MKIFRAKKFYDYIRIIKPATIRNRKNISLLIASICIIATVVIIAQPKAKDATKKQQSSGASYDKKQVEQEKKNSILRRFISYNQVKGVY